MPSHKKANFAVHYLPVFGCIATGIIYVAIGVIAILSFLKIKDGGADENSLLAFLNEFLAGKILVVIIVVGTISYIFWRIYETVTDPYGYGKNSKGIAKRTGIALSTIADGLIVYAAVRFLIAGGAENNQLSQQRNMVQDILNESWGQWLIIGVGCAVAVTAIIQLLYGITRGYRERLEVEEFSNLNRKIVHFLGITGYFARGIILGIIAFFYIKAGILHNGRVIVDTDKAFDFIGDNIGHTFFIVVALGTVCYGLFMFALAKAYDIDKD